MKQVCFILLALGFTGTCMAEGRVIRHESLRKKILATFQITETKGIIFQRFSGISKSTKQAEECEIQLKSSETTTTLDIIFPRSNRSQDSVKFSYDREIFEEVNGNQLKYSSHFISCSGDQYDTYRECWEYDHHDIKLQSAQKSLSLSMKGSICTIEMMF